MVTQSGVARYSQTNNAQDNPNIKVTRNKWVNMAKSCNGNSKDYAVSHYTRKGKKKYTYVVPHVVTTHDFRLINENNLGIPNEAYIKKVTINVRMRVNSSTIKVKAPTGSFMIYGGNGNVSQQKTDGKTGWYGSTYRVYQSKYLSKSWSTYQYTISGTEWNKMKYPTSRLNHNILGLDLSFNTPVKMSSTSVEVQFAWSSIVVEYDMPKYSLNYKNSKNNSSENPLEVNIGEEYCVELGFDNATRSNGGTKDVNVQLPFGTSLVSYTCSSNSSFQTVDEFEGKYVWRCDGKGLAKNTLKLCLQSGAYGLKTIDSSFDSNAPVQYFVYPYAPFGTDYGDLRVVPSTIQSLEPSWFSFSAKVKSNDSSITFGVTLDGEEKTNWNGISNEVLSYYEISRGDNALISWELEQNSKINGISIDEDHTNNNQITFNVPQNEEIEINWKGCFVPLFNSNSNKIIVIDGDTGGTHSVNYSCIPSTGKNIQFKLETYIIDHRMVTTTDVVGYVLHCSVRDSDSVMIESDCGLTARWWDDVAYIGCVPLNTSHYEPDHDFSNKGLSESYKNNTYKGKEGVYTEDTTFKIKLPPQDWTTLDGLSKLDKPIPVNAVPKAFEGDVLNFRGWYEITGTENVKKTNPLYYDGEVELDPLTHNINTRFIIQKGKSSNYTINSIVVPVVESGQEFANRTYIDTDGSVQSVNNGYFDVVTDGVYVYDNDFEENLRTLITMDNAQSISITSSKTIAELAEITLEWNSSKISENKENNIERIIYLTDENNNPIFKYQYCDFIYDNDKEYYQCTVIGSVIDNGVETVVINKELFLAVDIESLNLTVDSNGNVVQEAEPDDTEEDDPNLNEDIEETGTYAFNDYVFGSTLTFALKGNKLSVKDTGYNGLSINVDDIELPVAKYKYDLQFMNKNSDIETTEVLTFFDFEVQESLNTDTMGNLYGSMYVTSFPIAGKKILFTRESEEGIIYYLDDDNSNNYTYIQEPFYMYFCGVDIKSEKGSSLFDLDNSYTIFYLQNGLIRLGFNRLNGGLYLGKYDVLSKKYINVSYLQSTNTDYEISSYSDDKITISSGTTTYTMYRGHPYVVISHPNEEIEFLDLFNKVYGDSVNDEKYDYPMFFELLNKDNLLPSCVGSSNVSISCLEIGQNNDKQVIEENLTKPTVTLTKLTNTPYTNEVCYFQVVNDNSVDMYVLIDDLIVDVIKATGNNQPVTDSEGGYVKESELTSNYFGYVFNDTETHNVQVIEVGKSDVAVSMSDIVKVTTTPKPTTGGSTLNGDWKLEIVSLPSTMKYMDDINWKFRLTKGGTGVKGKTIERQLPNGSVWSAETDKNGYLTVGTPNLSNPTTLNDYRNWTVGKHTVYAVFYSYDDNNNKNGIIQRVSKQITIKKGTPRIYIAGASAKGKSATFKLVDPQGYGLPNKKLIVSINGKSYHKTTNSAGKVSMKINKKGTIKYKVTFAGDKNLNKATKTYSQKIR